MDIEIAAKGTAWGGLLNAGQVCTSLERVFVMESIADSFIEAVVEEAKNVRLGNPMNGKTDMGPMVSLAQLEKIAKKINPNKTNLKLEFKPALGIIRIYYDVVLKEIRDRGEKI